MAAFTSHLPAAHAAAPCLGRGKKTPGGLIPAADEECTSAEQTTPKRKKITDFFKSASTSSTKQSHLIVSAQSAAPSSQELGTNDEMRCAPCAPETLALRPTPLVPSSCCRLPSSHHSESTPARSGECTPPQSAASSAATTESAQTSEVECPTRYRFTTNGRRYKYRIGKWIHCCSKCELSPNYPDEEGKPNRLCSTHAKEAGSYAVQQPCRDCPDDEKLKAHYPDEEGKPNRLCSTHAKEAGSHVVRNPCRDCPDDNKIEANYPDEEGKPKHLCCIHAKATGCHVVLKNPCRDCPEDNKIEASYPDEEGKPKHLCSTHAKAAGSHVVLNPCRDCPEDNKLEAGYPDKEGKPNRLCSTHAKEAGSYAVQHPCRDCPEDNKIEACYPDEEGKPNRLCSTHAKEAGSYAVQHPCRDCPEDNKIEACYPDEEGKPNRLCSTHAKAAGSYAVRKPCRDCPEDNKIEACYPDEEGKVNRLCSTHAEAVGTHARAPAGSGASLKAMKCLDAVSRLQGEDIGWRIRMRPESTDGGVTFTTIVEGQEKMDLIPNSKLRPDGYREKRREVWLFHGNYYHGYPPGHPCCEEAGAHGVPCAELWQRTMEQHDLYFNAGCIVMYIWEHEFNATQRANYPRRLHDVIRQHKTLGSRPREDEYDH